MSKKQQKVPHGIVAITEVYENERSPSIWLCDTSKLDPVKHAGLLASLTEAINNKDGFNCNVVMQYDDGLNGDAYKARAKAPCTITAFVMLYTD